MSEEVNWKKYWAEKKGKIYKEGDGKSPSKEEKRKITQKLQEENEFLESPAGRARNAHQQGQKYFQISIPIDNVGRDALAVLGHSMVTKVKYVGDAIGIILGDIEKEGWVLFDAGFVFRQTRQDSRDKFLVSGQQVAISGETVGIYLFKRQ